MSTFTQPTVYSVNGNVTAANLNGNLQAQVTAGNSIDRTNLAGGTGIDASSMNPSSVAAATFGGAQQYTFNNGLSLGAELDFTGTTVTAGKVAIGGDAGATQGMLINVPTASTNGIQFQVNGVTKVSVPNTGVLTTVGNANIGGVLQASPTINASTVLGPTPPGYTSTGTALANTWHYVLGTTGSIGANGTSTITLTNNAVFSATYMVGLSYTDSNAVNTIAFVSLTSVTQFVIHNADAVNSHTFAWIAVGV